MRELLLILSVADQLYGLPTGLVREIVFLCATSSLPGQPSILHGFVNLRGESIPIVSLRSLFREVPAEPDIYAPVIILRGERGLGLLADEVLDVVDLADVQQVAAARDSSVNDCAETQFQTESGNVTVLSAAKLLLAQERERIAELQQQVAARLVECEGGSH